MANLELDATKFIEWYDHSIAGVNQIKEKFYELSAIIEVFTRPLVPLEKGYLENSFQEFVEVDGPVLEMKVRYSGEDNIYSRGYDYAYIQHIGNFNHPIRGEQFYLKKGMERAFPYIVVEIGTDYLTALGV